MLTSKVPLHLNSQRFKKSPKARVKENLGTCDKGREMVITRFAFIIAIDDKTLLRHIENYHAQETSSLTREVADDKGEKTTKKTTRAGGMGGGGGIQDFS